MPVVGLREKTCYDEEAMSKPERVNSADIAGAIRLGCRTMQNVFNADDNQVPFMGSLSERLHIHPIRVKMRGDAVVAMDNFDADVTFCDPYES